MNKFNTTKVKPSPIDTNPRVFDEIYKLSRHSQLVFQDYVTDESTSKVKLFWENPFMEEEELNYITNVKNHIHYTKDMNNEDFCVKDEADVKNILEQNEKELEL
jgi:hypothetical protein